MGRGNRGRGDQGRGRRSVGWRRSPSAAKTAPGRSTAFEAPVLERGCPPRRMPTLVEGGGREGGLHPIKRWETHQHCHMVFDSLSRRNRRTLYLIGRLPAVLLATSDSAQAAGRSLARTTSSLPPRIAATGGGAACGSVQWTVHGFPDVDG